MDYDVRTIVITSLRAKIGNWTYYVTVIMMKDFAQRVKLATDIYSNPALAEQMQRSLDQNHSNKIRDYILMDEQRLFNSMVIGVYGGQPQWLALQINAKNFSLNEIPSYVENSVGILVLNGQEDLYAIDGQHRLVGIQKAIKDKPERGEEQVSAIFVAHDKDTEDGLVRTRRLFSRLNRYAKPVSTYDKIALDEDDVVAIVVRNLVQSHPLFTGRKVSASRSNSLGESDRQSFTTLAFVYKALDFYLKSSNKELKFIYSQFSIQPNSAIIKNWTEFKRYRPEDQIVEYFYNVSKELWDILLEQFNIVNDYANQSIDTPSVVEYRHRQGGHVLFRPIGLQIVIMSIRNLIDLGATLKDATQAISRIPMELARIPWTGVIWNNSDHTMLTDAKNRKAAVSLLSYLALQYLPHIKPGSTDVKELLQNILQTSEPNLVDSYLNTR